MARMGHIRRGALVVAALMAGAPPALAASCMDDVQALSKQLGLAPSVPPQNGMPGAEPPATMESRGIPPEVTSRLSGAAPGNPIAARRSEALAALQSARAAAAQGNEPECSAQLAKAQAIFQERQP